MAKDLLRYDKMVEQAYRGIVREALAEVAEHGLPGAHHFYISFRTQAPGVELPGHLAAQYPSEITIVLEHQFWGLEVEADRFSVTLSFGNRAERLVVPIDAVTSFADPSVKFALQFQGPEVEPAAALPASRDAAPKALPQPSAETVSEDKPSPAKEKAAEVITLDSFRKR